MKHDAQDYEYFSCIRNDIIAQITSPVNRILEVGAASGGTLREIKRRGLAKETIGVDYIEFKEQAGRTNKIDQFIIADIEECLLPIKESTCDIIICADVLEHLTNPWKVISYLKSLLTPTGYLIVSLPNIREYHTFWHIFIRGTFPYTSSGIFDKTHLRFFCKKNMINLLEENGLAARSCVPSFYFFPHATRNILSKLTFRIFDQFLAVQYILIGTKNNR